MEYPLQITLPTERIAEFCRKWKVTEFSLFGSVLRGELRPESDIDVLVKLADDATIGLFEWIAMREELSALLGRKVDLVSRRGLESSRNALRRDEILSSAKVIHAT